MELGVTLATSELTTFSVYFRPLLKLSGKRVGQEFGRLRLYSQMAVRARRRPAIELQRIRISSVYVAFRYDGFRAQGLGTIHQSQTFHLRSRTLALMDIRHNDAVHISGAKEQPLDFR